MNKKVLVIEDDEIILEFVKLLLQQKDFAVIAVNNGQDGLAMAHMHHPDLIMSDLHMAGGDGLYVLRAVREAPDTADIPFVLVTADLNPEARQRCYAMGATQVFLKPFDPDLLVDSIGKLLAASTQHATREENVPVSGAVRAGNIPVE
jgi:CheY-like chemotaxis protein